ncbi:GTP-binding protein [Candidatus Magnetomoraceae bacterium gMMP-15]
MKIGIIGLSGTGKSTLFEALTGKAKNEISGVKGEYRIEIIEVPDERIDFLTNIYQPKKTIYTQVEYLLPQRGYGKEKKKDENIWTHVRNCDALAHVVRNFRGYGLEAPNPENDFNELNQEMIFADLVVAERRLERLAMDKKRGKKVNPEELQLITQCHEMLELDRPLRENMDLALNPLLRGFTFISAKPMLVLFNNEDDDDKIPDTGDIPHKENCIEVRGKLEQELSQMSEEEAAEFLKEFEINASAMDRVITACYELLGLISFFTVGKDEVRAWTIKKDTIALDAAEVIHSDIKQGFIRAEVLAYNDLVDAGSYKEARKKGTVRLEGKTYKVQDGDIIEFRFNV